MPRREEIRGPLRELGGVDFTNPNSYLGKVSKKLPLLIACWGVALMALLVLGALLFTR